MRHDIPLNIMAILLVVGSSVAVTIAGLVCNGGGGVAEAANSTVSKAYFPPGPVTGGWPANAVLIYCGSYSDTGLTRIHGRSDGGVVREDDGDWLPIDFAPYVTHLGDDRKPDDTFFDTFIFLAGSNRGRHFGGEYDQTKASLWYDWQWFINRIYAPGKQLQALEAATEAAAESLGKPDLTVNVYIMIPYPSYKVTDFGTIDGQEGGPSLLPVENRLTVVRWYVDEVIKRWQAWQPKRLRFAGFYWMQEHVNPAVPGEEVLVKGTADYVHKLGYKLGWIPWSGAYLATSWRDYDFDWAVIQPNWFNNKGTIESAVEKAQRARMGIEIELDGRVRSPEGMRKLYDYLEGGIRYGYMGNALIACYQDVAMLAQLYAAGGAQRRMYDDIYAFAKGKYGQTISGVVVDESGDPVYGARVQIQEWATTTDESGQFKLTSTYRGQYVLVSQAGKDTERVAVWPYVRSQPNAGFGADSRDAESKPLQLVLPVNRNDMVTRLLDFENPGNMEALLALGWTVKRAGDLRTQGTYALELCPTGPVKTLIWDISHSKAISDWSGYTAFALDVLVLNESGAELVSPVIVTFLVTLLDADGGRYTRRYPVPLFTAADAVGANENGDSHQGWQTLVMPLAAAASGAEHVDFLGSGEPAGINLNAVGRVIIAVESVSWGRSPAGQNAPHGEPPVPNRVCVDNFRLIR